MKTISLLLLSSAVMLCSTACKKKKNDDPAATPAYVGTFEQGGKTYTLTQGLMSIDTFKDYHKFGISTVIFTFASKGMVLEHTDSRITNTTGEGDMLEIYLQSEGMTLKDGLYEAMSITEMYAYNLTGIGVNLDIGGPNHNYAAPRAGCTVKVTTVDASKHHYKLEVETPKLKGVIDMPVFALKTF